MTPQEFVRKWRPVALTERQTAQEHFGDLCRLLGEPTPIEADPDGIDYAFEKGVGRANGGRGWADVWKRGHFALEYKKRHANLGAALKQLLNYAGALANPNGRPNSDVVRVYWSGDEALGRPRDRWVIDFGPAATEPEAQAYAAPYAHLERIVRDRRLANREGRAARRWWIHQRARSGMRGAIAGLDRFLVTVEVAKHRFFRWAPAGVLPSGSLVVFARTDDFFMGVLESRFHKLWASETHNPLGNRPRYRIGHSFESFPFPEGMAPNRSLGEVMANPLAVEIAAKAQALYAAREAALTSGAANMDMTVLYDLRDRGGAAWLKTAHRELDVAVAAAYGWSPDLTNDEILAALGALHQQRQGAALAAEDDGENGATGDEPDNDAG